MADKKPIRWHMCFGDYKDKKRCDGCIEETECLVETEDNIEAKAIKAAEAKAKKVVTTK